MKRVTGIGGVFFKAQDQKSLSEWYRERLGIEIQEQSYAAFPWRQKDDPDREGSTVWALFPRDTTYFDPSSSPFMINYRVENLEAILAQLRAEGVQVDDRTEEHEYGKFGWIMDPEGNRIELWEPPANEKY